MMNKLIILIALTICYPPVFATNAAENDAITQRVRQLFTDIKEAKKIATKPEAELNGYLEKLKHIFDTEGNPVENAIETLNSIETALAGERKVESFQSTIQLKFFYSEDGFIKLPLKNGIDLVPENHIKVAFEISKTEYVYVLYHDSSGKCTLLNPEKDFKQFPAGSHEIPLALEFFSLKEEKAGQQKVIVRTASHPLAKPTDCEPPTNMCQNCLHTLPFSLNETKKNLKKKRN